MNVVMRRTLDKSDMSGHEKIPLVGVRHANGGFFRAGSCLGDPKVGDIFVTSDISIELKGVALGVISQLIRF